MNDSERQARILKIDRRIDRFAALMKARMVSNLDKGDWSEDLPARTYLGICAHLGDLASDLLGSNIGGDVGRLNRCVNIANFAFILADNLAGHLFSEPPKIGFDINPDKD